MKNRLKHNSKFCEVGEMFEFVKTNLAREVDNIFIGECTSIYKSYTTQYRFKIREYNPSYKSISSSIKNIERPKLNNYYRENNIKEVNSSLLAKIKLMER